MCTRRRSAPETRRPGRPSFRRRRRSLLRRCTTAPRRTSPRSRRRRLRTATGFRARPPVFGAGRDDHRVAPERRGPSSIWTAYGCRSQVSCVAPFRDHDLGAEFLRPARTRAPGQLLPGDAGGKAEIVLDPRARAGLSARRVRLQHQHIETLRRAVDGRGQARRSGADDDDIAHVRLIDRVVEAEAVGDLLIGRVPKHDVAAADQDRHVADGDVKAIEQLLHVGVAVEIDVGVGVAVARQEFLDAKRAGGMRASRPARRRRGRARSARPGAG